VAIFRSKTKIQHDAHDDAANGVENDSSDGSIEIEFEDSDPVVTVEEGAGPESVLSGKDDIERDLCKAGYMTSIPTAVEDDHSSSGVTYTQPPQLLLPPSIDSLVAAKAAIAAQSRPTEAKMISEHGAEQRRHLHIRV
jgi:hypothetical protein